MKKKFETNLSEFPHLNHDHMQIMLKCFSVCSSCAKMCMEEKMAETAKLCTDCADVCALTIKLHSGESEFNEKVIHLCADVCARCAEECSKNEMEHCQQCAQVCHECADVCKGG